MIFWEIFTEWNKNLSLKNPWKNEKWNWRWKFRAEPLQCALFSSVFWQLFLTLALQHSNTISKTQYWVLESQFENHFISKIYASNIIYVVSAW